MRKEVSEEFENSTFDIKTMTDLEDSRGRVALLYADINNLGGQEEKKSFSEDRYFHEKVENAVKEAVHTAILTAMEIGYITENGKPQARFEIIALAGDDICLLLPGNVALLTAKIIADTFDKNDLGLTISIAACVANDTTAISYMETIVEQGLDQAKKDAMEKGESIINLSYFEQPSKIFPMTASEMNEFAELLAEASSVAATALRNISAARQELIFDEEFALYLNYYLLRDVKTIKKSRPVLDKINKQYEGKNPWTDFVTWRGQLLKKEVTSD
jgi:hypothetical protein